MKRFLVSPVLVFVAVVALAGPVAAGRSWCRTDPVIAVDGTLADVFVSGPVEAPLLVTGPTEIVVTVPVGVDAQLILAELGFGKGQVVTFRESPKLKRTATGIQLEIGVYVPAVDSDMPVRVEFAPRIVGLLAPESVEGTANQWVVLKTRL